MNEAVDTGLLEAGVDALPFGVVVLDHTGVIVYTNETSLPAIQEDIGIETSSLIGENYLTHCRHANEPHATAIVSGLEDILTRDREQFRHECQCSPFRRADDRLIRLDATPIECENDQYAAVSHTESRVSSSVRSKWVLVSVTTDMILL
ncbi:hypothetical protein BBD46_14440 [Natrialba sp. SSL1]|nr:hypothetical protein BBD46_14440 [Natrialba sp. SSL1]